MKLITLFLITSISLLSCSKNKNTDPPVIDNGPLGGNYAFTGYINATDDTTVSGTITAIHELHITGGNLKGHLTISATTITSTGLQYDYNMLDVTNYRNASSGIITTSFGTPVSGTKGSSSSLYTSSYTIAADSGYGVLSVDKGQYLFTPDSIAQPGDKKYAYFTTGNTLMIKTLFTNSAVRSKNQNAMLFTKQ